VTESLDELAAKLDAQEELSEADLVFRNNLRSMSEFLRLFNNVISVMQPLLVQKNAEHLHSMMQLMSGMALRPEEHQDTQE
jgi:hypothetical protein